MRDAQSEPDRPRQIAHVNLNARDFDASYRFFTETLGFRQIDENAPLWFFHCASPEPQLDRARQDEPPHPQSHRVRDARLRLGHARHGPDEGQRLSDRMGAGRHGPGNNVFAYFCGPDELPIEYTAEVLQIDDSYVPRESDYWKFPPGRSDHWGITQPRSARYYRVQRLFGFTEDGYRLGARSDMHKSCAGFPSENKETVPCGLARFC